MNKTGGVITHLEEKECDVCLIQETYLKVTDTAKIQEIKDNGWNIFSSPRNERSGGGIGVLYRDGVMVKLAPVKYKFKTFQVQEVLIGGEDDLLRLCNIYRPPYTGKARYTEANFLDEINDYFSDLLMKTGNPLIMGDFNFQVHDEDNFYARKLLEMLDSFDFIQNVPAEPTHVRGGTLDLVICQRDLAGKLRRLNIFPEGTLSDHFLVTADVELNTPGKDFITRKRISMYRDFKSVDVEAFKNELQRECLEVPDGASVEDTLGIYDKALNSVVERLVQMKRRKPMKNRRPWRDRQDVREALRKRRQAERAWEKNKTGLNKAQYKDLQRKFNKIDKEARMEFVKKNLEEVKDDPAALQKRLGHVLGKTETSLPSGPSDKKLADEFASFFSGKIEKIRSVIVQEQEGNPDEEPVASAEHVGCSLNQFEEISIGGLIRMVKDLSSKTCDLDPIPTWLVKDCLEELAPILTAIVNKSLKRACVPSSLQGALVMPTIKNPNGDKDLLSNYRPVSNIAFVSKLLEKVVLTQLNDYLWKNDLLNPNQSGYRVGHSCETLLAGMFDDLLKDLDSGKVAALMLLDMSAAFDTVDHQALIGVLEKRFGVTGLALDWFRSYLGSRNFHVSIRGELSAAIALICGVPQGSLLGPVLFLLYIEELQDIARPYGLSIKLYADDSQLYVSLIPTDAEGWNVTKHAVEECLAQMKRWMVSNWLKCNEDKTEFVLLGKSSSLEKLNFDPVINFGGSSLVPMKCQGQTGKTLGVLLDDHLTLERQVNNVKRQCGLTLKNLWQVNKCLDKSTKILLVKQLVISKIDYCNILYYGLPQRILANLQKTLNSCIRFVFNLHGHQDDYTEYFKEAHILPIQQRLTFKACLLAYKIVRGTAPKYLLELVPRDEEYGSARTTRATTVPDFYRLKYPKLSSINANSKLRRRRLSVFLPDVWNDLPLELRSVHPVDLFKTRLKTRLFQEAFGSATEL